MMVIILKMLMDGTMMIIKVTEGVTEKDWECFFSSIMDTFAIPKTVQIQTY